MATIVKHLSSNRLFILVGSGFGEYRTTQASVVFGNWHHDVTSGEHPMSCVCDNEGVMHWLASSELKVEFVDGQSPQGIFDDLPALPEPISRKLDEIWLERLRLEAKAEIREPSEELLQSLAGRGVEGTTLEYFEKINIKARKDSLVIYSASRVLRMIVTVAPNSEVWQHGYIAFARDGSGRIYCFNQNRLNFDGNAEIVRIDHPVGERISKEELQNTAQFVAVDLLGFLDLFLAGKLE